MSFSQEETPSVDSGITFKKVMVIFKSQNPCGPPALKNHRGPRHTENRIASTRINLGEENTVTCVCTHCLTDMYLHGM